MAKEALGMVETRGLTAAIEAADAMTKSAKRNAFITPPRLYSLRSEERRVGKEC